MKVMITLHLFVLCLFALSAQEVTDKYLFPRFEYARILYLNGSVAKAFVNYDLSISGFVYVDANDNQIKELGGIDKIGAIRTKDRSFRVGRNKIQELLLEKPLLLVEYKAKKKDLGKKGAYGTRSLAANIGDDFLGQASTYKYVERDDNGRWVISGNEKIYQIEQNNKMKYFSTFKRFLRIHPRQHRDVIKKYIQDNQITLESTEQVKCLCQFAASLD